MAKSNMGGKRASSGSLGTSLGGAVNNAQPIQPAQPVQQVQPVQTMSADYNAFVGMTDDEKADVITSMISQDVPDHLSDTDFQKFIYNIGLNDRPDVVDDATLDSMSGTELFRTVNNVYDRQNDISYSADQIIKQIQAGRVTRTSDNGGSVYGRGIYFADDKRGSSAYGNTRGNVKKTAIVRAKINSNAKTISHSSASAGARAEIKSGSKLGKALRKCDSDSAVSIYAMSKGYNVITSGHGYYNVLNRNAITMSKSINPI